MYKAPEKLAAIPPQGTLSRRREDHASEGPWKPKKYAAINQVRRPGRTARPARAAEV